MTYTVKEIFYTLQGEGAQSGRVAVFCRFSGCNLWTVAKRIVRARYVGFAIPISLEWGRTAASSRARSCLLMR
jgi:organic radical activating enzyme